MLFRSIKIPLKLQHVSVLTGPSSGSTSSLAKVTTVYYFSRYTYIGAVEACFHSTNVSVTWKIVLQMVQLGPKHVGVLMEF